MEQALLSFSHQWKLLFVFAKLGILVMLDTEAGNTREYCAEMTLELSCSGVGGASKKIEQNVV
jgi:hypothetical protein